jgi:hypothetical protein
MRRPSIGTDALTAFQAHQIALTATATEDWSVLDDIRAGLVDEAGGDRTYSCSVT